MAFLFLRERPKAAPTIADSQSGVFLTRSFPNFSRKPSVTLNTPPYSAISVDHLEVVKKNDIEELKNSDTIALHEKFYS